MELRQSVFIATSLDGFIARSNGDIEWLTGEAEESDEETYGYNEFIESVDALVMGRNSFEKVLSFDEWPYEVNVFVLTRRPLKIPEHLLERVSVTSGNPVDIVDRLSEKGYHHLYVDGGQTIQHFLRAGLIQEITLTRIPVIIGSGIPLFGPLKKDIRLHHLSTRTFDNGFVQSKYRVDHDRF